MTRKGLVVRLLVWSVGILREGKEEKRVVLIHDLLVGFLCYAVGVGLTDDVYQYVGSYWYSYYVSWHSLVAGSVMFH